MLLKQYPAGKIILTLKTSNKTKLNNNQQTIIVDIIVNHFFNNEIVFTYNDMHSYAKAINKMFSGEAVVSIRF